MTDALRLDRLEGHMDLALTLAPDLDDMDFAGIAADYERWAEMRDELERRAGVEGRGR